MLQLELSVASDYVIHKAMLYKFKNLGIDGSVLSIVTHYLSGYSHHVGVDVCFSKRHQVHSSVPQSSILGLVLFSSYTADLLQTTENPLYSYANYSTLIATIQSPERHHEVRRYTKDNLHCISRWCEK